MKALLLLLPLALLLAGCEDEDITPINDQLTPVVVETSNLREAQAANVAADLHEIGTQNEAAPVSPQRDAIAVLVDVAKADNGDVIANQDQATRAAEIARLATEGKLDEARRIADNAIKDGKALQSKLDAAESKALKLTQEAKDAGEQAAERERVLKQKLKDQETSWMTKILAGLGGLLMLAGVAIGVLAFYAGGLNPKLIGAAALCALSGMGCFAFLNFLHHSWIAYAVGGVLLVAGLATCTLIYLDQRSKTAKANLLTETAAHIVDQVEIQAKAAPDAIKGLKVALNGAMDKAHKDVVKELETLRPSKSG